MFLNGDSSHPFNRQPFTSNPPQPFPVGDFQRGLTDLFGLEANTRRPWLRVIWACSEDRDDYGPVAYDWSEYGAGGKGEWRRRYLYSATESYGEAFDEARGLWLSRQIWADISPPRFVVERLIPAHIQSIGWNGRARIIPEHPGFAEGIDSDGDPFTARKPIGGIYVPLEVDDRKTIRGGVIGDHNGTCCRNVEADDRICYGTFAAPGDGHLELLQKLTQAVKAAPERRPGLATPEELEETSRRTKKSYLDYWKDAESRLSERIYEALKTHRAAFSEDPTRRAWGQFYFTRGHSKSGLTAEERARFFDRKDTAA